MKQQMMIFWAVAGALGVAATKTRKAVHFTMVTSFGVKPNAYSGKIQSFAVLDDLFDC